MRMTPSKEYIWTYSFVLHAQVIDAICAYGRDHRPIQLLKQTYQYIGNLTALIPQTPRQI